MTVLIAGPYGLYLAYLWLYLQSGILRPPIADTGLRQVLIVGTQRYCTGVCRESVPHAPACCDARDLLAGGYAT